MNNYYNTPKLTGYELQTEEQHASNQEEIIMQLFKENPSLDFTPDEVWRTLGLFNTPITSIRRAITNLTKKGKLMKTNVQRTGGYGKKNFTWRLAIGDINDQLLML